jgi:hypothetical protein
VKHKENFVKLLEGESSVFMNVSINPGFQILGDDVYSTVTQQPIYSMDRLTMVMCRRSADRSQYYKTSSQRTVQEGCANGSYFKNDPPLILLLKKSFASQNFMGGVTERVNSTHVKRTHHNVKFIYSLADSFPKSLSFFSLYLHNSAYLKTCSLNLGITANVGMQNYLVRLFKRQEKHKSQAARYTHNSQDNVEKSIT